TLMSGAALGSKADPAAHTSSLSTGPILTMLSGAVGLGMAAPWLNALLMPAGQSNPLAGGWGLLPPLFILAMLAWIIGMRVLGRQSTAKLATPYIGGLPSSAPGSYVGPLGRNWTLSEGNEYATELFGEAKLTRLAGVLAAVLLLALVGGALI
ncbi:MAG: hypothetical protein KKF77_13525, partial [Proteobacteria bacterium]|nr:hypothetical protein [Pseudomonadota bacterium]